MSVKFRHFGELYRYLEASPSKEDFLHNRYNAGWKKFSKGEFLRSIHYLTLAFYENGWKGKQVALAVPSSSEWLMLDYALMFSGAVSVPPL